MAELSITRYRFRLARRGWARGDAGRRVMAAARQRLPWLVAERLAEVWTGGDDADVSEPVRLRFRVQLAELASACGSDETLAGLVARLLPAETDALTGTVDSAQRPRAKAISRRVETVVVQDASGRTAAADVSGVLLIWRACGDLSVRLESFSEGALEDWLRALLGSMDRRTHSGVGTRSSDAEAIVRAFATPALTTRADQLRRRIVAAVEVVARLDGRPDAPDLARALEDLLPMPDGELGAANAAARKRSSASKGTTRFHETRVGLSFSSRGNGEEWGQSHVRAIDSVLPFLLLRPLERLGYLEVLDAAFAAAGRRDELPALATALA